MLDQRVADGLLRGERIYGKDSVGIAVFDDGQIRREDETLDPPAVDDDAGGILDLRRELKDVVPEPAGIFRYVVFFDHTDHLLNTNSIIITRLFVL